MNTTESARTTALAFAETIADLGPFSCGDPECSVCPDNRERATLAVLSHNTSVRLQLIQDILESLSALKRGADNDSPECDFIWDDAIDCCIAAIHVD